MSKESYLQKVVLRESVETDSVDIGYAEMYSVDIGSAETDSADIGSAETYMLKK